MPPESLFQAGNTTALACWILLVFLPRYPILARLVIPVAACGLFGVVYVYIIRITQTHRIDLEEHPRADS